MRVFNLSRFDDVVADLNLNLNNKTVRGTKESNNAFTSILVELLDQSVVEPKWISKRVGNS